MRFAKDEMQRQQLEIPTTSDSYRLSADTGNLRFSATTQSEQQVAEPLEQDDLSFQETIFNRGSLEKEDGEYSDTLRASRSPNSTTSLASSELPLYSDINHQLDDLQEMLKVSELGTYEVPAELDGEERPRDRALQGRDRLHSALSPLRLKNPLDIAHSTDGAVHELPAELPGLVGANSPSLYRNVGTGIASPRPGLDQSEVQSPTLSCPLVTPLSPTFPVTPPIRTASESTETHSTSSKGNLRLPLSDFHEQRVEVGAAKKVKFGKGKKADYVALSPDCAYAAFVFSGQVQVNRIVSEWGEIQTSEAKVMLKLGEKAGKFVAAYLSSTHLVAISNTEIRICKYAPLELSPSSLVIRHLGQDVCANCVTISPFSDVIAVGLRVKANGPDRGPVRYYAAIQLYSLDLIPEMILKCQSAGDKEFPKCISFYGDGQAMLYSNNKTFGLWTHSINGWTETTLGSLEAKGPGAKGITSITPISLRSPDAGLPFGDQPFETLGHLSFKYYLVTSTLSNIAEKTASYTSSLRSHPQSESLAPWCEHLYRSAVSPDGRLAAFLTDTGRLKLASLVAGTGSSRLQMRDIPVGKFQAKKESEANNAAKVGIRDDPDGFVVIVVDRHGAVIKVRVVEAQKSGPGTDGRSYPLFKAASNKTPISPLAATVPELPNGYRELAAPSRFANHY
ncbi:MAG: hypothetical protein Q9201_000468 [Fulgogasparrea decipioides]